MDIQNLDKVKTEQAIANEEIRLDNCRVMLDKYKTEYDSLINEYKEKISNLQHKYFQVRDSIKNGEKFVNTCKEHLKDFADGE